MAFLDACFFTTFLAGVVTGAAAGASAEAGAAAGAGVAANVMPEPRRPAAIKRAARLDFMIDPKSNDHWVGCCDVGLEPTERDCKDPNLV